MNLSFQNPNLCEDVFLPIFLGVFVVLSITITTIFYSIKQKITVFPNSLKFIIFNLLFVSSTFFALVSIFLEKNLFEFVIPLAMMFYGILILSSRLQISKYITNFGFMIFILGFFSLNFLEYSKIFALVGLGFGHIFLGILLYLKNNLGKK